MSTNATNEGATKPRQLYKRTEPATASTPHSAPPSSEIRRWRAEEESFRAVWSQKSKIEKVTVDAEWLKPRNRRISTLIHSLLGKEMTKLLQEDITHPARSNGYRSGW
jgi:hypothetical protein